MILFFLLLYSLGFIRKSPTFWKLKAWKHLPITLSCCYKQARGPRLWFHSVQTDHFLSSFFFLPLKAESPSNVVFLLSPLTFPCVWFGSARSSQCSSIIFHREPLQGSFVKAAQDMNFTWVAHSFLSDWPRRVQCIQESTETQVPKHTTSRTPASAKAQIKTREEQHFAMLL